MNLGLAVELDITCLLGALTANLSCMVVYAQAMWINACYEQRERDGHSICNHGFYSFFCDALYLKVETLTFLSGGSNLERSSLPIYYEETGKCTR